ncbi:MAG: permease prefix domain 1-containing protein [Acidobacteriota bacterium]|jgi:hypothetical protein
MARAGGGEQVLEERIAEWRSHLKRRQAIDAADVDELEDHLRSQVAALKEAGLADDEAFLIAVKRIGELDELSREFAREYSERLWKRLVLAPEAEEAAGEGRKEAVIAVALGVAAAVAIKVPELFGVSLLGEAPRDQLFYLRNSSLFVLPFLAGFFAWKRGIGRAQRLWLAAPFVVAALVMNLMPFSLEGHTTALAVLHLPIALWLAVGFAYAAAQWHDHDKRMNYVRFSGEWFIYYALIAMGGGVFMGLTAFLFVSIGIEPEPLIQGWIMPCGALGAVIIAAWLVEAKQSVVENMAPVLTMLFTPLFTVLLLAFVVTMAVTGSVLDVQRELLIGFDLLLALVLGLILYAISARDPRKKPGLFDVLQLLLVVCALLVDVIALSAIAGRISEFGFSPNRVAALGENIVLLVNLGWSAMLYARFVTKRVPFALMERWQTAYLPVYFVWAWIVVVLFPLVFRFQ